MADYNTDQDDFVVGTVIELKGRTANIRMFKNSNQLYHFYNGKKYSGASIGSMIGIRRNKYTIIGKIEKEYASDTFSSNEIQEFRKDRFIRELEVKILGNLYKDEYMGGVGVFPQLFNDVILLSEDEKNTVIQIKDPSPKSPNDPKIPKLSIGRTWPDNIKYNIPWYYIFNGHMAIFGNTGSGKSNTLAKLYHELFTLHNKENKLNFGKSRFVLLDFNGEYTGEETIITNKNIIKLSTEEKNIKTNKLAIDEDEFWDVELLSILFDATEQTQRPFLSRVLDYYFLKEDTDFIFADYFSQAFGNVYSVNSKEGLDLLKRVLDLLDIEEHGEVSSWIPNTIVNSQNGNFYSINIINEWNPSQDGKAYYWNNSEGKLKTEKVKVRINIAEKLTEENIGPLKKLYLTCLLRLIFELRYNMAQYDHIAPLLSRISSRISDFERVIWISKKNEDMFIDGVTIISFENVNNDMKLLIPLLIAKISYKKHKKNRGDEYFNLIIDEAHNILSHSSIKESEKWKDYRLETFEEIIKEGRKFSYFLTISSQRPSDISATIVSQVHNYFIHRLVNDFDLKLLETTMTSLDLVSKDNIPNLGPGQTILTGVSFDLPVTINVDQLKKEIAPKSETISLIDNWL